MRAVLLVVVLLALAAGGAAPRVALASAQQTSSVHVQHNSIASGGIESVSIVARDLAGDPLANAHVTATVAFGRHRQALPARRTDAAGAATLSIHVPTEKKALRADVSVTVTNGFLSVPLSSSFGVRASGARPVTGGTGPSPSATPTGTTTMQTPSPPITVVAEAVPSSVAAPNPASVVAVVQSAAGQDLAGAEVQGVASFAEGAVSAAGTTDSTGSVLLHFDTSAIHSNETATIDVHATWDNLQADSTTTVQVTAPQAATSASPTVASPTASPTTVPSAAPIPTGVPDVLPTGTPTPVPSDTAPTSAPTAAPTSTPAPTATPVIVVNPTNTPVLPSTSTPAPTATPRSTPAPVAGCPGSQSACMQQMVNILNNDRAQYGVAPLSLNTTQSNGTSTCVGSIGHSTAMEQSGYIWHVNASYPKASFPNNICVFAYSEGENVGMTGGMSELQALSYLDNEMMAEPHDGNTCSTTVNHACNIIDSSYHQVGIGIYVDSAGGVWLTEDFIG